MFQPQPTPYSPFSSPFHPYGLHVANAAVPDYAFAPTPLLGQFGGGHGGGSMPTSIFPSTITFRCPYPYPTTNNAITIPASINDSNIKTSSNSANNHNHNNSGNSSSSSNINNTVIHINIHNNNNSNSNNTKAYHNTPASPTVPPSTTRWINNWSSIRTTWLNKKPLRGILNLNSSPPEGRSWVCMCGPLVGEKVSSQAITAEYAKADPTYVAKTMALPQTYSHYRPIQGDGNCGWRAIAFAYFEILVQCGDINLIQNELQRVTRLNKYIEDVGGQEHTIVELMVDETIVLFNEIIAAMSAGKDPMPDLVAKFNDSSVSQCLVYHLRLLAAARLKGNSTEYEPYLAVDVESYLQVTVMPVNREIDHICVALVHAILLAPANIVLDIAYLDRSEGTEVNVHRFPEEASGQDPSTLGPIIYLLYRPGHYDILYRDTQVRVPPAPVVADVQINRMTYPGQDFESPSPGLQGGAFAIDMSTLAMIPGLESASLAPFVPRSTPPPMADLYAPSPTSPWGSQPFTEVISAPTPSQPSPVQHSAPVHQLRFSKYNFPNLPEMAGENNNTYEPAFTTNTFKNSHFNTAHYNNQNFQPEMYQPGSEEEVPSSGNCKTGGRKRSTEYCLGIKKEK
ncbi:hypothetical protein ONZ43_g3855 [Nemania bipapillata]|uniref:Uncharacterized protein n=1 Tax=Nemania bipapillata TaxID=110536 RepID=A0ACC2IVI0_9PEZI|nr:hypothetical protein ONZ43_g3855 [Nemania bipapillata]